VYFPSLSSAGEKPVAAEGSRPLWEMGLLRKEKSDHELGGRSTLALVRKI